MTSFIFGTVLGANLGIALYAFWFRKQCDIAFKAGRESAEKMTAASHNNAYRAGFQEGLRTGSFGNG